MMDHKFFGLNATPFPAVPIAANCCQHSQFAEQVTTITESLTQSGGPCLIVGAAGTGKTMLLEVVAGQWRHQQRVIFLPDANFSSRREFLQTLLFELGLDYQHGDTGDLRLHLTAALRNDARLMSGVLLLIDEAHFLEFEHLEQLRLLSNLVREGRNQIQFVLAGTQQLEENLASPELASLSQRIAARVYLSGLSLHDLDGYLDFHWQRVGGHRHPFNPAAVQAIHTATSGIPRLVNQLCLSTLEYGSQHQVRQFDESIVQVAWARWQHIPIPERGCSQVESGASPASEDSGVSSGLDRVVQFGTLDDDRDHLASAQDVSGMPMGPGEPEPKESGESSPIAPTPQIANQITAPVAGPAVATADEPPAQAGAILARDSTAAQQSSQAQTLITFAFEADIQKPVSRRNVSQDASDAREKAASPPPLWSDIERRIDTIQQALGSLEASWDPVDEMLIEADLQAVVNPLEVVSQTAEDTRRQISTDPAIVFQDHLYLESLWMEDTVWTHFVQASGGDAETIPTALPHPSLQRQSAKERPLDLQAIDALRQHDIPDHKPGERSAKRHSAKLNPVGHNPADRDPADRDLADRDPADRDLADRDLADRDLADRDSRPMLAEASFSQIRIDESPGGYVSAPRGSIQRDLVPTIDSPQNVSWLEEGDELGGAVRVTQGPFQDDAAIIHRSAPLSDVAVGDQHVVHGPQGMEPPVMVRRKDLRALLHALRGY